MKNSEQCAFSCITAEGVAGQEYSGLTKREYAAIKIYAALIAAGVETPSELWAVQRADELFEKLDKPTTT